MVIDAERDRMSECMARGRMAVAAMPGPALARPRTHSHHHVADLPGMVEGDLVAELVDLSGFFAVAGQVPYRSQCHRALVEERVRRRCGGGRHEGHRDEGEPPERIDKSLVHWPSSLTGGE